MKLAALTLALSLCGCAFVRVEGNGYTVTAVYVFKDPKLDGLRVSTTQATVKDYDSATKMTGAEFGSIIATVAKLILLP